MDAEIRSPAHPPRPHMTGERFVKVAACVIILEPRLLGRKMGLSVLTVFLSLLVWSWIWRPIGMLLSVPLTMVMKIGLESTPDGWPIAVMLGSGPTEEKPVAVSPPES